MNVKGPDGNYPLASAAHDGLTEIVDALLVAGSEVNKQAATGATALHYAAFRGHAACLLTSAPFTSKASTISVRPLCAALASG